MKSLAFSSKTSFVMILLFLFISVFGVIRTHGQCDFTPVKTEISAFGTQRNFCTYTVRDGQKSADLKVLQGATFRTLDCHVCTCHQNGMRCCPSNKDPRTLRVPRYCRVVMDGCTPTAVLKSDNKTDCYTAQPVPVVRLHRERMNRAYQTLQKIDRYQRTQAQRGGETLEQNEVMMMLALTGALNVLIDNPYEPIGNLGGMGGGRGGSGMMGPPYMPMNDLTSLMMLGMMGSK